jgi:hypothetical protein
MGDDVPSAWAARVMPTQPTIDCHAMPKDQTPQVFSRTHDRFRLKEGLWYRYLLEPRPLEGLSGAGISEIDVRRRSSDIHIRPDAVLLT